jgi:DNA-binding response OmpR family regulator
MPSFTVIIADPDRDFRGALRVQLDAFGFASFVAADAREAVEWSTRRVPRLVILDVGLPRLGAFEACARMRQLWTLRSVPIVLVTRVDRRQIRQAAECAGASLVMAKPFSVNDLLRQLKLLTNDPGDPDDKIAWPEHAGAAACLAGGMAQPLRPVWAPSAKPTTQLGTAPAPDHWVREGAGRVQPETLMQGRYMLDVMRRTEAKRGVP